MAPSVSVVIPIYNVEAYLPQCLDSICSQTLDDIEIICVNDGSTDRSLDILESFASKDSRFRIVDKPNGGYGKAVNTGLDIAHGEFVSIVEPDDFIDKDMFSDLYYFASHPNKGGESVPGVADVVKGSYWEYYDAPSPEEAPLFSRPPLAYCMPHDTDFFSLKDSQDVICAHPSIWSALYRRQFLIDNSIRFIEPQGAGWADNPFLFQTLCLAEHIQWVPKAYYFYRQTNVSASSFLKDYRLPFDRLRDIRDFLATQNPSDDVLAAFYKRELDYIKDVVVTFGFSYADPGVRAAIDEVIQSMDGALVHSHPRLSADYAEQYDLYAGNIDLPSLPSCGSPKLSIVVPVGNEPVAATRISLDSLATFGDASFEVVWAPYGENAFAHRLCRSAFEPGYPDRAFSTRADALNDALHRARGKFALVMNLGDVLFPHPISKIIDICEHNHLDQCFSIAKDQRSLNLLTEARRNGTQLATREAAESTTRVADMTAYLANGENEQQRLLSALSFHACNHVFSLSFAKLHSLQFTADDSDAYIQFAASALIQDGMTGYAFHQLGGSAHEQNKEIEPFPCPFIPGECNYRFHTKAALGISLPQQTAQAESWGRSLGDLVLTAFVTDLHEARNEKAATLCFEQYFDQVCTATTLLSSRTPTDIGAYDTLNYLKQKGIASFFYRMTCMEADRRLRSDEELKDVYESHAFRIGTKLVSAGKKLIPRAIASHL